jgi:hypothetical protein
MKKIYTLLFLLYSLFSVAQNCPTVIPSATFQTYVTQISQQPNDQKKLERSYDMFNAGCLLSSQVKKTAQLFSSEDFKLTFCKAAYAYTYDRDSQEAYQVYDVFTSFSNAIRLYDFIRDAKPWNQKVDQITESVIPTKPEEIEPIFGDYQYPSDYNYSGPTGCAGPVIKDEIFMVWARKACCLPYDTERSQYIIENTNGVCISMKQAMMLTSFIHTHSLRLTTMKSLFPHIYDQGNFQSANQLFNTQELKNDWTSTIELTLKPAPIAKPVVDCKATDADVNNTIKSVNSKTFPSDKMDVLTLAAKNKCYSMAQIRKICELFMMENDKLAVMKIFYAKCTDKDHYDQLTDVFIAYYYQQELMQFIKNGGK